MAHYWTMEDWNQPSYESWDHSSYYPEPSPHEGWVDSSYYHESTPQYPSHVPPPHVSLEDMMRQVILQTQCTVSPEWSHERFLERQAQIELDHQARTASSKKLWEQIDRLTMRFENEDQLGSLPSCSSTITDTPLGPMPPPPTPWSEEEPKTSMDEAHGSFSQNTVHVPPLVGPRDFSFDPIIVPNDHSMDSSWWSPIENGVECIPCTPHFSSDSHNPIIEYDEGDMSDMESFEDLETIRCETDLDTTPELGDWDHSPPLVETSSFFVNEPCSVDPLDNLHKQPSRYIDPFYDLHDHIGLKHYLEHPLDDSHTFHLSFALTRLMDRIYPFPTFGIDPLSYGCLWLGYK